jgi:hypothetical protein
MNGEVMLRVEPDECLGTSPATTATLSDHGSTEKIIEMIGRSTAGTMVQRPRPHGGED